MESKRKLRDILEWSDGSEAFEKDLIEKVRMYKEIIIFGAGIGGKQTFELLEKYGYQENVIAFSDNNQDKVGGIYLGKPILAPQTLREKDEQLILVCSTAFDIILAQLQKLGIYKNIYFFQPAGMSNGGEDLQFIKDNINRFENVYEKLADEKSKKIYCNLLNYRMTRKNGYLQEINSFVDKEETQYFDKEILDQFSFSEGFVDAGAYIGDTIERFFSNYPQFNGDYYCMEAGQLVYERLCMNVQKMNREKIHTYKYAVWNEKGTLKFDTTTYGDGGGSRISDEGETVECETLDNLFKGKNIDFIKMDIEGAEKNALLGAKEVIRKNAPILTICIYHKKEDFYDIPETIMEILPEEYIFYVRQYRYGQSETVLYAMPKSRKNR